MTAAEFDLSVALFEGAQIPEDVVGLIEPTIFSVELEPPLSLALGSAADRLAGLDFDNWKTCWQ